MSDHDTPNTPTTNIHGVTAEDMADGVYRDISHYLDEASEHLTLQVEVLFTRLQDQRKDKRIPHAEADDLDLTVQALACVECARHELDTRKEREEFSRDTFERMVGLSAGEAP